MRGAVNYFGFGLSISSALPLPELETTTVSSDVVVRGGQVAKSGCQPTPDEEIFFVPGAGGFHIRHGSEIIVDLFARGDPIKLRRVLLGHAMAVVLRQRGWLALHASAAIVREQAVFIDQNKRSRIGDSCFPPNLLRLSDTARARHRLPVFYVPERQAHAADTLNQPVRRSIEDAGGLSHGLQWLKLYQVRLEQAGSPAPLS